MLQTVIAGGLFLFAKRGTLLASRHAFRGESGASRPGRQQRRPAMIEHQHGSSPGGHSLAEALANDIRPVVEAVCAELGIAARERKRRAAVEQRILVAWRSGPRQPLDLVRAGLDG